MPYKDLDKNWCSLDVEEDTDVGLEENNAVEYPQHILEVFGEAKEYTNILHDMLHLVDYYICGDADDEEIFLEKWSELRNTLYSVVQTHMLKGV